MSAADLLASVLVAAAQRTVSTAPHPFQGPGQFCKTCGRRRLLCEAPRPAPGA